MFGKEKIDLADTPDGIKRLREVLAEAEAVIIGAGAGLSTSAGFVYTGERFQKYFGDFAGKYHFSDMYSGGFYPYRSLEEQWAYWSRYVYINRYVSPPKPVYQDLYALVDGRAQGDKRTAPRKDHFILTTNVDHQFQKAGFEKERLFYTQGDYGLWQCSKPCHQRTYDNKDRIVRMVLAQGFGIGENGELLPPTRGDGQTDFDRLTMTVPADLVPYCPVCGEPMSMNLRADDTFVEDEGWHQASQRYSDFLHAHAEDRTVFLELAVGQNTPGIIKYPFWRMTYAQDKAVYVCLNHGEAYAPREIREKSICINGDIGDILRRL